MYNSSDGKIINDSPQISPVRRDTPIPELITDEAGISSPLFKNTGKDYFELASDGALEATVEKISDAQNTSRTLKTKPNSSEPHRIYGESSGLLPAVALWDESWRDSKSKEE